MPVAGWADLEAHASSLSGETEAEIKKELEQVLDGIPSLVFGSTAGFPHLSDEYVEMDSVIKTVKVVATFIVDWCGVNRLLPRSLERTLKNFW